MFRFGLLASLFAFALSSSSVTDCSDGHAQFQLTFLDISPQQVVTGTPVTLMLLYTNPGPEVTDGTVTTSASWNFIPIEPSTGPLCDSAKCPLVVGANNGSATTPWPDISGYVTSRDEWFGPSGELLLCIEMTVQTGANMVNGSDVCPVVSRWENKELIEARYFRGSMRA